MPRRQGSLPRDTHNPSFYLFFGLLCVLGLGTNHSSVEVAVGRRPTSGRTWVCRMKRDVLLTVAVPGSEPAQITPTSCFILVQRSLLLLLSNSSGYAGRCVLQMVSTGYDEMMTAGAQVTFDYSRKDSVLQPWAYLLYLWSSKISLKDSITPIHG